MDDFVMTEIILTDQNFSISVAFAIDALPTLMLFHNKRIIQQFIGVQSKEVIACAINSIITNKKEQSQL